MNDSKQARAWVEEPNKTGLEVSAGADSQRLGTLGAQSEHLKELVGTAVTFDKDLF